MEEQLKSGEKVGGSGVMTYSTRLLRALLVKNPIIRRARSESVSEPVGIAGEVFGVWIEKASMHAGGNAILGSRHAMPPGQAWAKTKTASSRTQGFSCGNGEQQDKHLVLSRCTAGLCWIISRFSSGTVLSRSCGGNRMCKGVGR